MSDDHEMFLGMFKVKKVIIVTDHSFQLPDTDTTLNVRPVSLDQLSRDKSKLAMQEIYIFPQPGDMSKRIFLVYYDRNIELNSKA